MSHDTINFQDDFVQIVDGKSLPTEKTRHGVNPANLQAKAEVPVASQEDLDCAVAAAQRAFKTWNKTPYEERRRQVLAYANAIDTLRAEFRDLLIAEQGKPVSTYSNIGEDISNFPRPFRQMPKLIQLLNGFAGWQPSRFQKT